MLLPTWAFFVVSTVMPGVLATIPLSSVQRQTSPQLLPNTFIVELDSISDLPGKRALQTAHATFYSALAKRADKNFTVEHEFNSPNIFVGASIKLSGSQDLATISNIPGVKAIRPVVKIPRPQIFDVRIPSSPQDQVVPGDTESTHTMTGVDKLHARGITGNGIKIGIIDTGTDYTNPALGGGFGPGKKVAGGFDFVGDAYDGTNTPVQGPNPLDQCAGHGTHVAGIIGANPDNAFNISGVAFDATLFSYRIFGCQGFTTDDIIVEALLRGASDGMDILTLSLGGENGWTEGTASVVASRLADQGKVLTIAAGNDGHFGSWYPSSPATGIDVISVSSVDNTGIAIQNATTSDPSHPTIPYFSAIPLPIPGDLPIYVTSNDTTIANDACSPLPANTPDLSRFLVIIRRGGCTFVTKLGNIAAKGAKFSLIYNNGVGFNAISTGNFVTALIQATDGQFLASQFAAGKNITVSFPQSGRSFNLPSPTGGLVSSFTSYGPTYDLFFKPAVAAPGGNILSTWPVKFGSFAVLSGTSMATPFVAGSSALLLQEHVTDAKGIRTRLETTAHKIPSSNTDGAPLQTLTQQGAGLINVFNAVDFKTRVHPGEILLNDTAHFKGSHVITVQNMGSYAQKYTVSHVPAGTAVTIQPGTIFASDGPVPLTTASATVHLSTTQFTLGPYGVRPIIVTFTPPANVDKTTFPVYSGFIQIESATEMLHVAYEGVAAAMKDMKVLDNTNVVFGVPLPTVLDSTGAVQSNATNYTFVGNDFPTLLYRLTAGSPRIVVDLVRPGLKLPPRGGFNGVPTVGTLGKFDFLSRNSDAQDQANNGFSVLPLSTPAFANKSRIPNGQYRVLARALKITGNPQNEGDYETFLSPVVGVNVS